MARIDGLLLGYIVFCVRGEDVPKLADSLLKLGISAKIKKNNSCEIRLSDARSLRSELLGRIDFTESEVQGLPGFIYRNRRRYGTFAGIITAVLILILSSGSVWDVRIEGVGEEASEETLSLLSDAGVYVGARWSDIDKNEVEARLLSRSEKAAWININRRGTVAYITVKEKDSFKEDEYIPRYSNIVASSDAVIEEINVKSGYALVKPGDVVKRGDILISGIIPAELGGGLCRAEGVIKGRIADSFSVSVGEYYEEKRYISEKCVNKSYKILGFSINILKNSRNSRAMCDIIEYKSDVMLFGKYKLPIEKYTAIELEYKVEKHKRTKDELVISCSDKLSELLHGELANAELLKIKTDGEYTADGYMMKSDVIALKDIGLETEMATSRAENQFCPKREEIYG